MPGCITSVVPQSVNYGALLKSALPSSFGAKRSLAAVNSRSGFEALERFVRKEPLRRTHECAFGVLTLESELVGPRL